MNSKLILTTIAAAGLLAACEPAPTPQAQAARQHEIACLSGTVGGALIGGVIGNQFGGGSGRAALTAVGAGLGAAGGNRYSC
ncbi:glycine zipper 2TM domain-containing protein [Ruegeria sediminis]|uniref:17 kDa surface antigen n=1 Tax=Ruegeria sediminis TaxID=2583820 RepID=A0ABY2WVQ3_9RHOB|nr:glycine zipper 2TM domain-containing protein [Ruegeria sediminis]TMV06838.1 glycine zipper 2TM domain-containing protein [Ruegeria sediminis]